MWVCYLDRVSADENDDDDGCIGRIALPKDEAVVLGRKHFFSGSSVDLKVSREHATFCVRVRGGVPILEVSGKGYVRGVAVDGKKIFLQPGDVYALLSKDKHAFKFVAKKAAALESETKKRKTDSLNEFKTAKAVVEEKEQKAEILSSVLQSSSSGGVGVGKMIGSVDKPSSFTWYVNTMPNRNNAGCLDLRLLFKDNGIQRLIVTSFQLDSEWLCSYIPAFKHIPVWVSCSQRPEYLPKNWTHEQPFLSQRFGTPHGKIFIIQFYDKIRVIISTANVLALDYEYKSNGIWTQDFARINGTDKSEFGEILRDYIRRLGCDLDLTKYDMSTASVSLLASVPCRYKLDKEKNLRYGLRRLEQIVSQNNAKAKGEPLVYQCSSLGTLPEAYTKSIASSVG